MRKITPVLASVALLAGCAADGPPPDPEPAPAPVVRVGSRDLAMEGPLVHGNLALFVLRGPESDARTWTTLDRGLADGTVVVAEKGAREGADEAEVNELVIENRGDRWLFLQAGDVVSGGKQDRVVARDVALAPRTPARPLDAFCVEQGRWAADGDINLQPSGGAGFALPNHRFGANTALINGPALRRAIQVEVAQVAVWREVAAQQGEEVLADLMDVHDIAQARGFPSAGTGTYNALLLLEPVAKAREDAVAALLDGLLRREDALGLVAVVDGEIVGADAYASHGLFRAMARKLVESYATDAALAAREEGEAAPALPGPEAVAAFLAGAAGPAREEGREGHLRRRVREGKEVVHLEYLRVVDGGGEEALHGNWIRK